MISIAIVGVSGEFPIFDDWAYTRAVQYLLREGQLRLDDAQAVLMLPQLAVGWIVTSVTGFSFVSLRLIGIASAMVASAAAYTALRAGGANWGIAAVAAITISVNPVAHVTAYTFSSDVPTMALAALAIAAYVRAVRHDSRGWMIAAAALAITTVLNRQSALALVLGFAAGQFVPPASAKRAAAGIAIAATAWLALWLGEQFVLAQQPVLPDIYTRRAGELGAVLRALAEPAMLRQVGWAYVRQLLYIGLFTLPLWLASGVRVTRVAGGVAATLGAVLVIANRPLPLLGGILYADGLGPITIDGPITSVLSPPFWWIVTAAAVVGSAGFVDVAIDALRDIWRRGHQSDATRRIRAACLVAIVALTTLHALIGPFDRHLLVILPAALLLVGTRRTLGTSGTLGALGTLTAFAVFSIAATRDCLEWERARWSVIRALEAQGVTADQLDGGLDYNRYRSGRVGTPDPRVTTHHVAFVQERQADALFCEERRAWIGPMALAICARPGPSPFLLSSWRP